MSIIPIKFFGVSISLFVAALTVLLTFQGVAYLAENDLHYGLNILIVLVTILLFMYLVHRYYERMRNLLLCLFPITALIIMNALSSFLHSVIFGKVPPAHDYSFLFIFPVVTIFLLAYGFYFDRMKNRQIKP